MVTTTRYNIKSVQNMMLQIEAWIDQTEETLGNEESKDYPNDERLESLEERRSALQDAYDALRGIE